MKKQGVIRAIRASDGGGPGDAITFLASTSGEVRGDLFQIPGKSWDLTNYNNNPVVLWAHDYRGERLPIGKATARVEGDELKADIVFDQDDPFARQIESKYRNGFLHAVSVGFDIMDFEERTKVDDPWRAAKTDLLDISAVPVPSDPAALKERQKRFLQDLSQDIDLLLGDDDPDPAEASTARREADGLAIFSRGFEGDDYQPGPQPIHSTGITTEERADPDLTKVGAEFAAYFAYVIRDGDTDEFLLLHHAKDGKAAWRDVAACMVALYRGVAGVPDEDFEAVFEHLARHYRQAKQTPPEFMHPDLLRTYTPELIGGLFAAGERDMFPDQFESQIEVRDPVTRTQIREHAMVLRALADDLLALAGDDAPADDGLDLTKLEALRDSLKGQPEQGQE